jgi:hypothetical protein
VQQAKPAVGLRRLAFDPQVRNRTKADLLFVTKIRSLALAIAAISKSFVHYRTLAAHATASARLVASSLSGCSTRVSSGLATRRSHSSQSGYWGGLSPRSLINRGDSSSASGTNGFARARETWKSQLSP